MEGLDGFTFEAHKGILFMSLFAVFLVGVNDFLFVVASISCNISILSLCSFVSIKLVCLDQKVQAS